MAETMSVTAILDAKDKGMTAGLNRARSALSDLGSSVKNSVAFGFLQQAGSAAFNALSNGATDLISDINSSSKAWQTFEGNMSNFGKSADEITAVKTSLQDFATTTIYSASDMASTYSQLEAVGVGSMKKLEGGTEGLVKGFGGLAAASEDPAQAMKSLSQQATQMAAKPKVAWEDFKIMMEQSPAGMAAVADAMGKTTQQLIADVQKGKVKTEDLFAAIEQAGNSDGFQEMATKYKTVDQAMDGLKETLGNKLLPAFEALSAIGITAISGIADKIGEIDGEALKEKLLAGIEAAQPYWEAFKDIAGQVGEAIQSVAGFLAEHGDTISKALPYVIGLVAAYKGFKILNSIIPGMSAFTGAIGKLAAKGIAGLAGKLFGISGGMTATGSASAASAASTLKMALATLALGAAVLLAAAGVALLVQSAIALAGAGWGAAGALVLLVGIIAGLAVGAAALGPALTAGAVGFIAFGAAVALVGAGAALAGVGLMLVANSLPLVIAYGASGAAAIAELGAGMLTFSGGAFAAGAACIVLGAGLALISAALVVAGAAMILLGLGAVIAAAALAIISAILPQLSAHGTSGAAAITALGTALLTFAGGAAVAGAACIALGAGLLVVAAGALATAAGTLALAAACIVLGAGLLLVMASGAAVAAIFPVAAAGALLTAAAFAAALGISAGLSGILLAVSASLVALAASSAAGAVGVAAFGIAIAAAAVGALAMDVALAGVAASMKTIASNAKKAESSLNSMTDAVSAVESGLGAIGDMAQSALGDIADAFNDAASEAVSAGQDLGNGYANGVQSGMALATAAASAGTSVVTSTLMSGRAGAMAAGAFISQGFAIGMQSCLAQIRAAAAAMVKAAQAAIEAKAMIASPSKLTKELGGFFGEGFVIGISDMYKDAKAAAENLVSIPAVATPKLAGAFGGELSADYDYYRNAEFIIDVPLTLDGKEVARATASYTQEELDRRQTRDSRKQGIR